MSLSVCFTVHVPITCSFSAIYEMNIYSYYNSMQTEDSDGPKTTGCFFGILYSQGYPLESSTLYLDWDLRPGKRL